MESTDRILEIKKLIYNSSKVQDDISDALQKNSNGTVTAKYSSSDGLHFIVENCRTKNIIADAFNAISQSIKIDYGKELYQSESYRIANVLPISNNTYNIII